MAIIAGNTEKNIMLFPPKLIKKKESWFILYPKTEKAQSKCQTSYFCEKVERAAAGP